MYNNRNILDLGANIRQQSSFFRPVELPMGTIDGNYFENRSQYSRVADVLPPAHVNETCPFENCDFKEPIYF